ncbi:TetR family transcriptional regulator [Cohnella sp. CIP 111063]|jgi:AcrR family transcriptional regulator|uniref:TetR/AcrR family transcriptional regulator n=1 Tax=unclassified Cohnella TaxID=2636738 RepID=UPI000B8BDB82|nr:MULTISPECIES: TetR family transcriptional regulator [unclassified Cohnella]OXS61316.1 TetR family transcriptional regulator [Cohnella sp. CIP 111063]PRX73655.1 TetR family transcriptional regulator [Cohnella sp. SGD-V74]
MRKSKEEAQETIRRLVEIAREHFTERGYADTALEAVVQEANITRGAVYHHFRNKKDLFRTVLEAVQQEVAERIEQAASASDDVWEQLFFGCRAFVLAAVEPRNKRIMLIDGPAILGWEVWRAMDQKHSMRLLRGQLEIMQELGYLKAVPLEVTTHFLSGALNETSLWLASREAADPSALEDAMKAIEWFMDGVKRQESDASGREEGR